MKREPDDVLLVVRPMKNAGPHPFSRLKRLLKSMKRAYGFRCVELGPASAFAADLELLEAMPELTAAVRDEAA